MIIKTNLIFRACVPYINANGQKKLILRFLDEKDNCYTFYTDDNDKSSKFKNLKKEEIVNLELGLSKKDKNTYSLFLKL